MDTAAHSSSVENTIAVIAGGIDHIYPPENAKLFAQIGEEGLILAELPVGSVPLGQHFPQRNRIISGLSLAVVVIEASLKSGSLITARLAAEQGREVFAVPGFPLDPRCQGTNKLIKDGAYLVESADDIIENLPNLENLESHLSDKHQDTVDFNVIKIDYALLSDKNRCLVRESLSAMPVSFEEVVISTQLPIPVIYTILLEFELAGRVARHPGSKFSLIY
ncbi:MAG: DNA-protecting protein DprA [Rickettsiaceae bacterium]|nr:DNA-protecting protein DprA [Rickettsiaceae bacterium]